MKMELNLSQAKEINEFGFSNKAGKSRLKEIVISIPVNENGTYNIVEQKKIAQQYNEIEKKKKVLLEQKNILLNTLISANYAKDYAHKEVGIEELFVPVNGSGEYTKKFCNENRGVFPVYSGNTKNEFANINKYDYEGSYLTWAKDGLAGYIMKLSGKFSITNHRGILIPTEACKNVDLDYIKYILEPIFRSSIKGRKGHDGQNEYTTLNETMIKQIKTRLYIPVMEDGSFDLNAQKEIAQKYHKIEQIISSICSKIDELVAIKISI